MNIIGIAGQVHDASAALVADGRIVGAAAEERFTRRKHVSLLDLGGIPARSIEFCLNRGALRADDVTDVAYFMQPIPDFIYRLRLDVSRANRSLPYAFKRFRLELRYLNGHLRTVRALKRHFPSANVHFVDHHTAHANSAYWCSQYQTAAALTLDQKGEQSATRLTHFASDGLQRVVLDIPFPHSIGFLYASLTKYLGFTPNSDEFKVMGLASYGKPNYRHFVEAMAPVTPDGSYRLNEEFISPGWESHHLGPAAIRTLGKPRSRTDPVEQRHADIAASLQQVVEDRAVRLARLLHERTGERRLVMAGGVALNCAMNSAVAALGLFDEIFVQPAAGDEGTSLGAALFVASNSRPPARDFDHSYWGPEYADEDVKAALEACRLPHLKVTADDRAERVARLLSDGMVVALFDGRMEWGPRALGNRSILADPRAIEMKDRLNRKIKFRETFRPFAPAVLEEDCADYFDLPIEGPAPYMLFLATVKREVRSRIPAVVHVDGTARVQTASRRTNRLLWEILTAFKALTGIPVLVNTSFNLAGEPIVCSPSDAIRTFTRSEIDALSIGGFLVARNERLLRRL